MASTTVRSVASYPANMRHHASWHRDSRSHPYEGEGYSRKAPASAAYCLWLHSRGEQRRYANIAYDQRLGWIVLGVGSVGLVSMSVWPNYGYPVVWLAPLVILTTWQTLLGRPTIFAPVQRGDWRSIWLWALAALVCGGFWEMWNVYSLAKWVYTVPFVNRFHVFEMPLLGYGGYLPFGLECATVIELLTATISVEQGRPLQRQDH